MESEMNTLTRKCSICKIVKTLHEFVKNRGMKYGVGYTCYVCQKLRNSKMLEKVLCSSCNMYISKMHFRRHLNCRLHKLLLYKQQIEEAMLNQISVC